MATGDQSDITSRLRGLLPQGWFATIATVLTAILQAPANAMSWIYGLYAYARLQARIRTATDGFLDLISLDYFGTGLPRQQGELDSLYRARIIANLLPQRVTRAGISAAIQRLTGTAPTIFEPFNVNDATCCGAPNQGYGVAGGWGSLQLNAQFFIQVTLPPGTGIANVNGYGGYLGGYGVGAMEWVNPNMIAGQVTAAQVNNTIEATKAAGVTAWTNIIG